MPEPGSSLGTIEGANQFGFLCGLADGPQTLASVIGLFVPLPAVTSTPATE